MLQGTSPTNYRNTVGTENDYFLRSKNSNEQTGSTGLDPTSILFSSLPRLRTPVLQSPFNSITQKTPTQQTPGQQPQQQPVHYSSYKSMGNVHLKPYQGKDRIR
jgi:hypothetical protein